jgi:nucleotide-binding universal stress UspA family protein
MNDRADVIVVGVDGSAGADAALDFALREGAARGYPVEVVTAWLWVSTSDMLGHQHQMQDGKVVVQAVQDEVVEQSLARVGVSPAVTRLVVHDYAGRVLSARGKDAAMLVIGSGAQSSSTDRTLGSVAEYCLRHAPVPVVLVPQLGRMRDRATDPTLSAVSA